MNAATIIRDARQRHGLTQAELAHRIGSSQPVISAYEHGTRDPSLSTLRRIVAGTGDQLVIGWARRASDLPALVTPGQRGEVLVDLLLLADAIPPPRKASRPLRFPRISSTSPQR